MRWFGSMWTAPNTLLGVLVGVLLTHGRPRRIPGQPFTAFASGRGISSFVKRLGPWATTFGEVVVSWEPTAVEDPSFLAHEAWHVGQYRRLGPLFLPIYLACVPFTGWRERHPLERAAYRAGRP